MLVGRVKGEVGVERKTENQPVDRCSQAEVALTGKVSQNYETWEPSRGMGAP